MYRRQLSIQLCKIMLSDNTNSNKRGALLVFEGCDRSGKSIQSQKLCSHLEKSGHSVELGRFPERSTAIGKMINEYLESSTNLSDEAIHLLFSANRWESANEMKAKLAAGITMIIDRYAYSGVAYSAAKGIDLSWCKSADIGLPLPDAVFFCDLHPNMAKNRGGFGQERYETFDMQLKVYHQYGKLRDSNWIMIDALESIEKVHINIIRHTEKIIEEIANSELKKLWAQ